MEAIAVLPRKSTSYPQTLPDPFHPRGEQLDAYLAHPHTIWTPHPYRRKPFGTLEISKDENVRRVKERAAQLPLTVSLETRALLTLDTLQTLHPLVISRRNGFIETDDTQHLRYLAREVYGKDGLRDGFIVWNALEDGRKPPLAGIPPGITAFDWHLRLMMLTDPSLRIDLIQPENTRANVEKVYAALAERYQRRDEAQRAFTRRMKKILEESVGRLLQRGLLPEPTLA